MSKYVTSVDWKMGFDVGYQAAIKDFEKNNVRLRKVEQDIYDIKEMVNVISGALYSLEKRISASKK